MNGICRGILCVLLKRSPGSRKGIILSTLSYFFFELKMICTLVRYHLL